MPAHGRCTVVVGCQWGDEGKGKIVDVLAEGVDIVARYQGGANAGHTVEVRETPRRYRARVIGVTADGRLAVEDEAGTTRVVADAEIRFAAAGRS